ncbi:MAG: site-specific DNA-methyltransferase [Acidobacteria bacterium]|nr:site-specific DNA-methyltransferase [Acidobacteriota bacterium]
MSRLPQPEISIRAHGATYRFYLGDCLEIFDRLTPTSIDVIVTSPPYNLSIQYRTYDDSIPRGEYLRWTGEWVRRAAAALAPDGSLFLNVGAKPTDPWTALDVAQAARQHLRLQNTIHWIKSIAIERALAGSRARLDEDLAVGHYKPINSRRFLHDCHEFVFHFTPRGATPIDRRAIGVRYQDPSNVGRWRAAASGVRCRGNTWFIPYETIQNREKDRPHPATFPPRLPEMCLRLHGLDRIRLVADPFLGLGSTAVACAQLGVSFVGIEMDKRYLNEAVGRTRKVLNGHP